ncbi:hypothetical protein AUJ84_03680 [Candidatus Pacearchaeota archaeon CG1_02_32_132]|nr:MAG: hypothetical protein AUJ84_03680 [Candidatus Pacearchaeota archaeon CG1_02_32_132]
MPEDLTKTQQAEVQKEVKKQIKVLQRTKEIGSEFKKQASTAMIAGLSLLVALAWKDLIFKLIENYTSLTLLEKYPFIADLYTAVLLTLIGVIGIMIISRWAKKPEKA